MAEEKEPKVSIIIPARSVNDYLKESIPHILNLDYQNFEILVFPDSESGEEFEKTRIIPVSKMGPAPKRNLSLKYGQGEIFAFLDDDAYPSRDWLKKAVSYFQNPEIAAVCGPGLTPFDDSINQKASGWVLASFLGGGPQAHYRFLAKSKREVDDYPSMNLIVRRTDFEAIKGFDSHFWPGEDTHLCLGLTKKLGKKIIYDPEVLVYHHRRALFIPHLKQVSRYGLHRGHFARILPETSRRLTYFLPSFFLLFLLGTPLFLLLALKIFGLKPIIINQLFSAYLFVIGFYWLALLMTAFWVYLKEKSFKIAFLVMPGIFSTHLCYGFYFVRGFFSGKLKEV